MAHRRLMSLLFEVANQAIARSKALYTPLNPIKSHKPAGDVKNANRSFIVSLWILDYRLESGNKSQIKENKTIIARANLLLPFNSFLKVVYRDNLTTLG